MHAAFSALRVCLQHHVADGACRVDVAVGASSDARLLTAAQARSGLRDALFEAFVANGLRAMRRKERDGRSGSRSIGREKARRRKAGRGITFRGESISCVARADREEFQRVRVRQLRLDLVHHRFRVLAVHPERKRRATRRVLTIPPRIGLLLCLVLLIPIGVWTSEIGHMYKMLDYYTRTESGEQAASKLLSDYGLGMMDTWNL